MQIRSTTVSLTVEDVVSSSGFFTQHLGYREQVAAEGFASLTHPGSGVDVVFLQRGIEVLPQDQRDQTATGVVLALVVEDLELELARLQSEDVHITLPLHEEEWGERLFQIHDPNGVIVQLVQWNQDSGPSAWQE